MSHSLPRETWPELSANSWRRVEDVIIPVGRSVMLSAKSRVFSAQNPTIATLRSGSFNTFSILDATDQFYLGGDILVGHNSPEPSEAVIPELSGIVFGQTSVNAAGTTKQSAIREHFSVSRHTDSYISVKDLGSNNGTFISGVARLLPKLPGETKVETRSSELSYSKRQRSPDKRAPYGYSHDLPIIGPASPTVLNGILTHGGIESIVVDSRSPELRKLADEFKTAVGVLSRRGGLSNREELLRWALKTASSTLRYDTDKTIAAVKDRPHAKGPMLLSEFVDLGFGVCRHQNLVSAFLMTQLIHEGWLSGRAHFERNNIPTRSRNGHGWSVYSEQGKRSVVVDASHNFAGTRQAALLKKNSWPYILKNE